MVSTARDGRRKAERVILSARSMAWRASSKSALMSSRRYATGVSRALAACSACLATSLRGSPR